MSKMDFIIVSILHDVTELELIANSGTDIFDLTGKIDSST
jgi:hypothetical protein